MCTPGSSCIMVYEVAKKETLKSVELTVNRYPIQGGGEGAVQETNTLLIPFCLAMRLVGAAGAPASINYVVPLVHRYKKCSINYYWPCKL